MIIEFNSSGIGMFMMVLKELWDSFGKFCRYCCNILIYDIMSSWTRRFLTHLNRVLVFRKLVLWAWNFLWGFIFWGCHFIKLKRFCCSWKFYFFRFSLANTIRDFCHRLKGWVVIRVQGVGVILLNQIFFTYFVIFIFSFPPAF